MKELTRKKRKKNLLHSAKGAIDSTFMTIIGLGLVSLLMFIIPMMSIAENNKEIAQTKAQAEVNKAVNDWSTKGEIDLSDLEKLQLNLNSTGNTFEITIEVQHLDENPGQKVSQTGENLIGENLRYSTFIYPEDLENGTYELNKGDIIIVTVRNTNKTLAQQLRTFVYKVTGQGTFEIVASSSSMVVN